ncbi:MAG TPA: hypothetical protein VKU01_31640 [Bryobacteraceae bacterium]|nr:hypothetical protein [Bryobacteraceae bacterium]
MFTQKRPTQAERTQDYIMRAGFSRCTVKPPQATLLASRAPDEFVTEHFSQRFRRTDAPSVTVESHHFLCDALDCLCKFLLAVAIEIDCDVGAQ